MVSSVGVAWTRTFRPLMSSTLWISFLLYIERKPSVASPITCEPCTVSSIIVLTASETRGSASALVRWSSERKRKCSDITPACGDTVAVLADDVMAKSISPDFNIAGFQQLQHL